MTSMEFVFKRIQMIQWKLSMMNSNDSIECCMESQMGEMRCFAQISSVSRC